MSKPDASQVRRSRIQLVLIFALFLLPPVSAWFAWKYLGERGSARPPMPAPDFAGKAACLRSAWPGRVACRWMMESCEDAGPT